MQMCRRQTRGGVRPRFFGFATERLTANRTTRSPQVFGLFAHVKNELVEKVEQTFERCFDDEIQNKDEDVDGGEGAGKPLPGANDRYGKHSREDRKRTLILNNAPSRTARTNAKGEITYEREKE